MTVKELKELIEPLEDSVIIGVNISDDTKEEDTIIHVASSESISVEIPKEDSNILWIFGHIS